MDFAPIVNEKGPILKYSAGKLHIIIDFRLKVTTVAGNHALDMTGRAVDVIYVLIM